MMYVRFPQSLRQVEDLLSERGIDICHETVRYWWNRFGPLFAAEIRKRRVQRHWYSNWRWHLDEVFVRINGKTCYLWRAVDHEGEVLEVFATERRDRRAALRFLKRWSGRLHLTASKAPGRNAHGVRSINEGGVHGASYYHRHRHFKEEFSTSWGNGGRQAGVRQKAFARKVPRIPLRSAAVPGCDGGLRRRALLGSTDHRSWTRAS